MIVRALWVTAYLVVTTLLLKNLSDECRGWTFSFSVLVNDLRELSGWIVAAFGAIYLAFYSRFSAQWSYLANMYNQIKQAEVTRSDFLNTAEQLAQWKAGFIEDALELHLASKPSIAGIICAWSQDPKIEAAFVQFTLAGKARWAHVLNLANSAKSSTELQWK